MKNVICHLNRRWIIVSAMFFISVHAFAQSKDSIAVMKAANRFIKAFDHFQWEIFKTSFTDDASIFFPEWDFVTRVSGRDSIEKTWLEIFPEFKDNPKSDSMSITPRNISIRLYNQTAVMTFHLGNGVERLSRRTIVWVKQRNEWKIAHLHASVMFAPKK